jgi:hypothetical protein
MTTYAQARNAWLAEHPGPNTIDFACPSPRCKAQPGELCSKPDGTISAGFHIGRQDRHARAFMRWQRDASDAADAVACEQHVNTCAGYRRVEH